MSKRIFYAEYIICITNNEMKTLSIKTESKIRFSPAEQAEIFRHAISNKLDPKKKGALGQYLTPLPVATFMASLFGEPLKDIVLFDPGAGTGTLTAAFVQEMISRVDKPHSIHTESYELEPLMAQYLESTIKECAYSSELSGVRFSGEVTRADFIKWGFEHLKTRGTLFEELLPQFTHCIMNPPYKKIRSDSDHRRWLQKIGIETGNLYSGFLAIAIKLLSFGGELVAIVPRSFCNGPYFQPFRNLLLDNMAISDIHVFEHRDKAFKDDEVLQENIILHAVKGTEQGRVRITSSSGDNFDEMTHREVPFDNVVKPNDPDRFIHIATCEIDQMVVDRISLFNQTLEDIGIDVCTGPVVDFRLRDDIRQAVEEGACPLIYPGHFTNNYVEWPNLEGKKPNSIYESKKSSRWLMENGWYVVTRRFSAKEESRRIIAALHTPERVISKKIGFENHLNVFHQDKKGLPAAVAKGLAVFLNSTLLDLYFRQFSGHTQVNATDLRMLYYPDIDTLIRIGEHVNCGFPKQDKIDQILDEELDKMTTKKTKNPLLIKDRTDEALSILKELELPKEQLNERSALTLLALVDLKPETSWEKAGKPLIGITPIMDYIRDHYGKEYAPNTRETIRRQTMHQFVQAGIAVINPDKPGRQTNSPKYCYQIAPDTLELIRTFSKNRWKKKLKSYLIKKPTLAKQYAKHRDMQMVPLEINGGKKLGLTPGKHSQLIKVIITEFGPRYAPDAKVLYVGDTGSKMTHFDEETFKNLGLTFDSHGKFPDVVLHLESKNWLLLIESVTSHGPVDAKRHAELALLFKDSTAGIIYVTAFPDRPTMGKYLGNISWETEVWVADAPDHLIHFNGERFLGPYLKN